MDVHNATSYALQVKASETYFLAHEDLIGDAIQDAVRDTGNIYYSCMPMNL